MARDVQQIIDDVGFEFTGTVPASQLKTRSEVRDMCAANTCGFYDACWTCPPACGSIEDFQKIFDEKQTCYVFETYGKMEDDFDYEAIMETGEKHKERLHKVAKAMSEEHPDALVLGAGGCDICPKCTYPDEPCRFPNMAITAMEASGLLVADVCKAAGMEYNHGPQTISYISCVVI